jgi:hypothetical protein
MTNLTWDAFAQLDRYRTIMHRLGTELDGKPEINLERRENRELSSVTQAIAR